MTTGNRRERLLIVRLSAMGDVLQTLPALVALRAARPEAEIGWAVERRFAALLIGHPAIDRLFVFERRKGGGLGGNVRALLRLRRELRAWAPDTAIDAQANLRGALVTRISGARRRIALPAGEAREGAHLLATAVVAPAPGPREHRAARALRLVGPLLDGVAGAAQTVGTPLLPEVTDADRRAVATALAEVGAARPFVLFIAGTSDFGAFKRWPAEHFGALAVRVREHTGMPVLISFGPGQQALAQAIAAASDGAASPAPATRSMGELRALLAAATLVVGADSGPVVLAGAAGRPTVALFGPKDPRVYAPPGAAAAAVWKGVYCSPCVLRRCDDPICMRQMTPGDVWPAVAAALAPLRVPAEGRP